MEQYWRLRPHLRVVLRHCLLQPSVLTTHQVLSIPLELIFNLDKLRHDPSIIPRKSYSPLFSFELSRDSVSRSYLCSRSGPLNLRVLRCGHHAPGNNTSQSLSRLAAGGWDSSGQARSGRVRDNRRVLSSRSPLSQNLRRWAAWCLVWTRG